MMIERGYRELGMMMVVGETWKVKTPICGHPHLAPLLVHLIPQSNHFVQLGNVGGYDQNVGLPDNRRDIFSHFLQSGFINIGHSDFESKSIVKRLRSQQACTFRDRHWMQDSLCQLLCCGPPNATCSASDDGDPASMYYRM